VVGFVGRIEPGKGVLDLVRAMRGVDARLVIVGDGPERPSLEAELQLLGIDDRVQLAGERDDVRDLLADADIFVLSSVSEGLPVSVLEAMAAELPVVASRVGGVPELVADGENGFLVPPGNPDELAAAVGRLVEDRDLRRRLGAVGRVRAETRFNPNSFRRAHLELYAGELARRSLPAPSSAAALVNR
jgi:glycosyltransferase involved in cell wall biosynthesis